MEPGSAIADLAALTASQPMAYVVQYPPMGSASMDALAVGLSNVVLQQPMGPTAAGVAAQPHPYYAQPQYAAWPAGTTVAYSGGMPMVAGLPSQQSGQGVPFPRSAQNGGTGRQQPAADRQPPRRRRKVPKELDSNVRKTVYISYIDQTATEDMLATFFADCGTVVDCRICGDAHSAMRFAFIEFIDEASANNAIARSGSMLGSCPLRVMRSKTAIVPVNTALMPRSMDEVERCGRTVYAANIDNKVDKHDVRAFFEQLCGKVTRLRLLGDTQHTTRIAFVEFAQAESALAALHCSGALLGSLPLRVSPSKTPVRGDKDDAEGGGGGGSFPA